MSEATMNELYQRTGILWWVYDLFASGFEVFLYLLMFDWWQPTSFVGKVIKFPLKCVGTFVAIPFSLPLTAAAYAWWTGTLVI
jgi:hypothetical protein